MLKTLVRGSVVKQNDTLFDEVSTRPILYIEWEATDKKVVFIVPETKCEITIEDEEISFIHPHLLFVIDNDTLSVFALDTPLPGKNSPLYYAPFPNIYDKSSDNVCLGNYSIKEYFTVNELIEETENWFFTSHFNHWHYNKYSNKELYEHKEKNWKKENLKPFKKATINSII